MRKLVLLLIILVGFSFLSFKDNSSLKYKRASENVMVREDGGKYIIGVINLKLKENAGGITDKTFGISAIDNVLNQYTVSKVFQKFPLRANISQRKPMDEDIAKIYTIKYSGKIDPNELSEEIKRNCANVIEYVEPEFVYEADFIPNDPSVGSQYHISKINCYQGWDINQGDTNVVIGIVDSGSDLDHPDLAANIKYNYADPVNGLDDDGNGFVDDFKGWDFFYFDNDPNINGGSDHGSHVSGCASQVTNNNVHGSGPGFKCKLRISKHAPDYPDNGIYSFTQGIDYLYHNPGVKVINCSFGSGSYSSVAQNLINAAYAAGVVVCASAGNDGADLFRYPACYEHVVSVAASTSTDTKAGFSNFHDSVDVIAPGASILSTVYNNSYAVFDGTSMSTPITCGNVAIIRSKYPAYTPDQTVAKLKLAVDSIYHLNPAYVGKLGTGRINMFKAVTESPIISLLSFSAKDSLYGNNDNVFDINEKVTITISYKNTWFAGNNISLRLTSTDPDIEITKDSLYVGNLAAYYSYSTVVTNTFEVRAKSTCPMDKQITFRLANSSTAYVDNNSNTMNITFRLGFATHNINNLKLALTRDGAVGKKSQAYGTGLNITGYTGNNILEGGLMIGTSDTKVSDVCRRGSAGPVSDTDFTGLSTYSLVTQGGYQYGTGSFNDNGAGSNKIGVTVKPESFAYNNAPDQNYIILRYTIKNTSGAGISNMYAGLYMYYTPLAVNTNNTTEIDAVNKLGYTYNNTTPNPYLGVALLSNQTLNFKALNSTEVLNGFTTLEKWNALKNGLTDSLSSGPGINCMVISAGPFNLNNNEETTVGFVIVKGNDLNDLKTNTITAKNKYPIIGISQVGTIIPDKFSLYQNYPNPFNPRTTIKFDLAKADFVSISVYDILGRIVEKYSEQLNAGSYSYDFDATNFATGVYFYRIESNYFSDIKKMVLIK